MAIYSHSRLGAFETCPRKFWFAYISKPEIKAVDSVEAFLGSRVHEGLEELYNRLIGGQEMPIGELLAWYDNQWDRSWHDGVQIVNRTFTASDYRQVGRQSLKAYHERYAPFDQARTLRTETQVFLSLDAAGMYRMQGYIDRLDQRRDGGYEIHDYKTSRHVPTQAEADGDRQLALYQLGVQDMWPGAATVDLIWHYLRFDKEIRSLRTAEQLEAVKRECIATIDDIESRGKDEARFPTSPSNLCDWCEYRGLCPATRHYVAVAALPPKQFKANEGVSLVDGWVAIRDRRQELQEQDAALAAEEETIQAQIIEFARQQGLEAIAGSFHHVDVVQKTHIEYPKTGDDRRADFEEALRKAGLWDEVVAINWASLSSAWKDDQLPSSARKLLKPFVSESTEIQAKLRKGGTEE